MFKTLLKAFALGVIMTVGMYLSIGYGVFEMTLGDVWQDKRLVTDLGINLVTFTLCFYVILLNGIKR